MVFSICSYSRSKRNFLVDFPSSLSVYTKPGLFTERKKSSPICVLQMYKLVGLFALTTVLGEIQKT